MLRMHKIIHAGAYRYDISLLMLNSIPRSFTKENCHNLHAPCITPSINVREGMFFKGEGGGGVFFEIFGKKSHGPPTCWNELMHDLL